MGHPVSLDALFGASGAITDNVQRWAKEWAIGCSNSPPVAGWRRDSLNFCPALYIETVLPLEREIAYTVDLFQSQVPRTNRYPV